MKKLLITIVSLLVFASSYSQCKINVPSSNGYEVDVVLRAVDIIATKPCDYGYNFNVKIEYDISFSGTSIGKGMPSKRETSKSFKLFPFKEASACSFHFAKSTPINFSEFFFTL